MSSGRQGVLILGAGINGCAIARELAINGVPLWLVDSADIASGATSGSSRLIHGGLRYLEYGEFDLVKESLQERTRLLHLAPQFVHPLKLWIPSASRFGGAVGAVGRFFNWSWWPTPVPKRGRGVALVGAGLRMYDAYARDSELPKHSVMPITAAGAPPVNRAKYRWVSSYYDAQVTFPERLTLALVQDARAAAASHGAGFEVFTHHRAALREGSVEITPLPTARDRRAVTIEPALIVNATGAWVDDTLARLHVDAARLMGGTKGSHLFSFSPRLRTLLAGQGVYAEADDGRPIFITPLADAVLIGTTDERFEGAPETAQATPAEIEYLIKSVDAILPEARLTADDIAFHYSAVRPLPYVSAASTAAISRRHALVRHPQASVPLLSVVGGKLTTMRSLAQITASEVLAQLGRKMSADSRGLRIAGAEDYPASDEALAERQQQIAARTGYSPASVMDVWRLLGTRAADVLADCAARDPSHALLDGTNLPLALAAWSIEHEHAATLADLVERRLMLLYHQRLTTACLEQLARLLDADNAAKIAAEETARLAARYGKRVTIE